MEIEYSKLQKLSAMCPVRVIGVAIGLENTDYYIDQSDGRNPGPRRRDEVAPKRQGGNRL
jgi:hypothetical protein